MVQVQSSYRGLDRVKESIVLQLRAFLANPIYYKWICKTDFSKASVHTEFPLKTQHLPLIAVSDTNTNGHFIDIRASNFVVDLFDEETGDLTAQRYGGADTISLNVDIATLSVPQRQQLADLVKMWFHFIARDALSREGIQVTGIRMGSNSEIPQDQEPNFVYTAAIGVDLWVDWYVDIPSEVVEQINVNANKHSKC